MKVRSGRKPGFYSQILLDGDVIEHCAVGKITAAQVRNRLKGRYYAVCKRHGLRLHVYELRAERLTFHVFATRAGVLPDAAWIEWRFIQSYKYPGKIKGLRA